MIFISLLIDLTILSHEIWHILSAIISKTIQNSCERGGIYDLLHSRVYVMQTKLFLNSYVSTLSSFHFENLTKSLAILLQVMLACFLIFWFVCNFLLSLNSFLVKMILQGRIWIVIQIIHFLIDVLSLVDRFNLTSLNLSLSFRSMSNDSYDFLGLLPLWLQRIECLITIHNRNVWSILG